MTPQTPAIRLARLLRVHGVRVVFAESCTAGLASALLAGVPGISEFHCGSAVTYRESTKTAWLGISPATLARYTAVSAETTAEMARGVLRNTPEAEISAAVTGHLGPDAPPAMDGRIFVAICRRCTNGTAVMTEPSHRHMQLRAATRVARQSEAACFVLESLCTALETA